jgi:hypothetical protein
VLPLPRVLGIVGPLVLRCVDGETEVGVVRRGQLKARLVGLGDQAGLLADDAPRAERVHHRYLHLVQQTGLDQLADHDVHVGGQVDGEGVTLHDLDDLRESIGPHGVVEAAGQHRVDLHGVHLGRSRGCGEQGQDPGAGAHLDHCVARSHHRLDGRPERERALPVDQAEVGVVGVGPDDATRFAHRPRSPHHPRHHPRRGGNSSHPRATRPFTHPGRASAVACAPWR